MGYSIQRVKAGHPMPWKWELYSGNTKPGETIETVKIMVQKSILASDPEIFIQALYPW